MESCELESEYARKRPRLHSTPPPQPQTPAPRPAPQYSLARKPSLARSNSRRLAQGGRPWRPVGRASAPATSISARDTTSVLAGTGGARRRGIQAEEMDWSQPYSSPSLTGSQDTPSSYQPCTPSPIQLDSRRARPIFNMSALTWDFSADGSGITDRLSRTGTEFHGQLPSSAFNAANAMKAGSESQDRCAAAGTTYIVVPVPSSTSGMSVRVEVNVNMAGARG